MHTTALSIKFAGQPLRQSVKLCEYAQKLHLNQANFLTAGFIDPWCLDARPSAGIAIGLYRDGGTLFR
jgi:hypothetical protein